MPVTVVAANFEVDLRAADGDLRIAASFGSAMAPSRPPLKTSRLTVRVVGDLSGVNPADWNALEHGPSPFLEYGFLRALESSGSIGLSSGWNPSYLLVEAQPAQSGGGAQGAEATPRSRLRGAVACFRKEHSYGEYIFDFAWARASMRAGLAYYPKLVVAAPVTPASGRRILFAPDTGVAEREEIVTLSCAALRELADRWACSSIHWLFTTPDEQSALERHGYLSRSSFQFHWHNAGYEDFEAFSSSLSSRKRKQIRKERRRAREAVDAIELVPGPELSGEDIAALDRFYRTTTARHGGEAYLRPGFFERLVESMPDRIRFARATREARIIAGALYLETEAALYGRYWGCAEDIEFLHFELAYYQGIERCIQQGLPLFEAGAQGEHKLLRGFTPSPTYSSHWIRHPGLRDGVRRFLREEHAAVRSTMTELDRFTPYKRKTAE
jgi:uncharacterized protein